MFKIKNKWFWGLQFIGWGLLVGSNTFLKLILSHTETIWRIYFAVEGFSLMLFGILGSLLIRLFLKRNDFIENQNITNYGKLLGVVFLANILTTTCVYIVCYSFVHVFELSKEDFVTTKVIITSVNITIYHFFWAVFYIVIKSVIKYQKGKVAQTELKIALKAAQLNTLKGQINPHFMFNSLNNIRGLMLEDVPKSREMITRLSEMLRYSLNSNKIDTITIEEELDIVENYIELSKIQLEDRLHFIQEITPDTIAYTIPPMLIQMLVENAIKHGISKEINGGEIILKIHKIQEYIQIEVRNTGELRMDTISTKIGLSNIKKRLELLYGERGSFLLEEKEKMVVAIIKIPIR